MNLKLTTALLVTTVLLSAHQATAQRKKDRDKETIPVAAPHPWEVDTLIKPIPINRQGFTDKVAAQVRRADLRDGTVDQKIELQDSTTSRMLTEVLLYQVPKIMIHIENLEQADHRAKLGYHRSLEGLMRRLNVLSLETGDLSYFRKSVNNFEAIIIAKEEKRLHEFIQQNANIYTLDNGDLLDDFPEEKAYVFETVGTAKPEIMIKRLPEYAKEAYADPIVATAAKVVPGTILTYATSTSFLRSTIRRNQDPLVQSIVLIANESRSPLKVLPFLGDIHNNRKTVAEIDAITEDPIQYYKALVGLKLQNETIAKDYIDKELKLRGLQFVRVVNELHDSPAPVRFRSLSPFNAEDIYFMLIGSQDEIYTSSFTWMFHRMTELMNPTPGDEFLSKIHHDHFRTFIRMCAGYNTLSDFLATMGQDQKKTLMREFVANLEKGQPDDLEDAVDVADAFGSLTDKTIIDFLKSEIRANYERTYAANNQESEKGVIVYGLLSTIFNHNESDAGLNNNLTSIIPPITYVPYEFLRDSTTSSVVQQVFFYGDKDGMGAYNNYLNLFRNNKWEIEYTNKYWTKITATGKNKVTIYSNVPLPEEAEENDEFAQNKLQAYLDEQGIHPSVIIHRGHSYYLPTTLKHLSPSARIIVLGSCGGYHNLATVLDASPDAHIISSKQVGALRINVPIINALNDDLIAGRDVNWIDMWKNLSSYFASQGAGQQDLFSDYIPPNKNLGAIFIKAYRKMAMASNQ